MNPRIFTRSIFAACILALMFGTAAAQATGNKPSDTSSTTAATNTTPNSGQSKNTMHKHSQHNAASHNASHTHHKHVASAAPASDSATAYRAALKSSVEGPAAQRDGCIDGAIVRFGRS